MDGKIDFIVCEKEGTWYFESLNVPVEIAAQPNKVIIEWAKKERFDDEPDIIYVGVYWRDEVLDENGLTTEATVSKVYEKYQKSNVC